VREQAAEIPFFRSLLKSAGEKTFDCAEAVAELWGARPTPPTVTQVRQPAPLPPRTVNLAQNKVRRNRGKKRG